MTDKTKKSLGRLDEGGFANADIPRGFERIRDPHEDVPLTPRGRVIFLTISFIIVLVVLMIVLSIKLR